MITADEAREIADSKARSEHGSPLFKYAMDLIERYVRDAAGRGRRSFSCDVDVLGPGYSKPDLHLREVVAAELKMNGFSYHETRKGPNCTWFKVSW